jgi:hypothetical protein
MLQTLRECGCEVSCADASLFVVKQGGWRSFRLVSVDNGVVVGETQDVGRIIDAVGVPPTPANAAASSLHHDHLVTRSHLCIYDHALFVPVQTL